MAQSSGPIAQGTASERQLTDVTWRDLFGDEPGVVGDMDGTAYALTLPSSSDIVSVGSASQVSTAKVAGFVHRIPAGSPEPITIPTASGTARTDIIALRYDPAFTGLPGPVRLTRIAGTTSALPTYDGGPPGVEDLPLWSITRQPGQALSQATVQQLFPRLAPVLDLPAGAALPLSSPLGTLLRQGQAAYRRELVSNAPTWTREKLDFNNAGTSGVLAGTAPPAGTALTTKTVYASIVFNAQGDGTVFYPLGAFPNGVVAVTAIHVSAGASPPSNDIGFVPWNITLSSMALRCYSPNGAVFGGTGVPCIVTLIGW